METQRLISSDNSPSNRTTADQSAEPVHFKSREENLFYPQVYDIDPRELHEKLVEQKQVIRLIDVRQREEFHGELGRLPKSELIVLDELAQHLHLFKADETIVFVCRSGSRSAKASQIALNFGLKNTYNMKGGMILWNELRLPLELV
jgi:hydroxyacylglutathione hydrolase